MLKKVFTYLLIFFAGSALTAQINLVPNPGFEVYYSCPTNIGSFDSAIGWISALNSPDYFNSCAPYSTSPYSSSPNNFWGYQLPSSGDAYAGITTYIDGCCPEYREIMGTQLISPLLIGQKYFVKFNLSLTLGYTSNGGADKTGIRFSMVQHNSSNPPAINNFSHVYSSTIITDSLNWSTVFGSFTADSSYPYLELGNFFDNASTNFQMLRFQASNWSYYYIDDICVSTDSLYSLNWTTSLNENIQHKETLGLYPNPSAGKVYINSPTFDPENIMITDVMGRVCRYTLNADNSIELENSGIYFITLLRKGFPSLSAKVIISR